MWNRANLVSKNVRCEANVRSGGVRGLFNLFLGPSRRGFQKGCKQTYAGLWRRFNVHLLHKVHLGVLDAFPKACNGLKRAVFNVCLYVYVCCIRVRRFFLSWAFIGRGLNVRCNVAKKRQCTFWFIKSGAILSELREEHGLAGFYGLCARGE